MTVSPDAQRELDHTSLHLTTALLWLRLRLERLAGASGTDHGRTDPELPALVPVVSAEVPAVPADRQRRRFWQRRDPSAAVPAPLPVATVSRPVASTTGPRVEARRDIDAEIAEAAARMAELAAGPCEPPIIRLGRRLGLSGFERDVLLLCVAMDLDTRIARLCADAQGDPAATSPTFALALSLFDDPVWEALAPDRPLRSARLIDVHGNAVQPLTTRPLLADERIVNYCKGLNRTDRRLTELFVPFAYSSVETMGLVPSQQPVVAMIARRFDAGDKPVVHMVGPDRPSKQLLARHLADHLDQPLVRLPLEALPSDLRELEELIRLFQRESALLPLALYVDAYDAAAVTTGSDATLGNLNRLLGPHEGITILDARDVISTIEIDAVVVDVRPPTASEQRDIWAAALDLPRAGVPSRLAGQFDLSAPVIARIARVVSLTTDGTEADTADRAWWECLGHVRPQLDTLAERIDPHAAWDDLILPDDVKDLLRRIADQVAQRSTVYHDWGVANGADRGLGITALFAGESGTGKTMAAEVLADELRLNLYRIDLSAVVSKYIGETEKNLRRVFDASDNGGTLLFFDEADALFGKRSEVKDSHDRYANIEINYLLQRMEAYRGLAILATNMKMALDQAFTRRLRFIVNFPFPDRDGREEIWRHAFGDDVPTAGIDHQALAKLNLSGGSIRNVAMNATFLAAASPDRRVTMATIATAARMELRKMNRPFNEADLETVAGRVTGGVTR